MAAEAKVNHVPTNVITGFLGVGKTTAIERLLRLKPSNERWAVLVNEFGEVGIDSQLLNGSYSQEAGVYLREVPGGCMCCASGLPMQIALNMLLKTAKPDRLLIEPTGLGHPKEVLAVLMSAYYRDILHLHSTITLLDARKLNDARYLDNPIFQQQLSIADVLVANKADLYVTDTFSQLKQFHENQAQLKSKPLHIVEQGQLNFEWLQGDCHFSKISDKSASAANDRAFVTTSFAPQIPDCGYLRIDNQGQGFHSSGWIFNEDYIFDETRLFHFLSGITATRLKAVFITNDGVLGYNKVDDVLTSAHLDDASDSRIEVISKDSECLDSIEGLLLQCVVSA